MNALVCIEHKNVSNEKRNHLFWEKVGGSEKSRGGSSPGLELQSRPRHLSTLSADTAGQLNVLGHDGDTLGVDGAQVGVLEQTNQVRLAGLL